MSTRRRVLPMSAYSDDIRGMGRGMRNEMATPLIYTAVETVAPEGAIRCSSRGGEGDVRWLGRGRVKVRCVRVQRPAHLSSTL